MVFQDLVNQIKVEARISSDTEFDPMVIGLINELFKEAVESQRPFELRNEVPLTLSAQNPQVTLPDDFFIHHQVFFKDINTGIIYQLNDEDKASAPCPRALYGNPNVFQVAQGFIYVKPPDQIVSGDQINLIYYKKPPEIVQADLITQNPIPRLEPFIIRGVIRRIRMFHSDDLQVAQMLSGDISSAAKGYMNDGPERDQKSGA